MFFLLDSTSTTTSKVELAREFRKPIFHSEFHFDQDFNFETYWGIRVPMLLYGIPRRLRYRRWNWNSGKRIPVLNPTPKRIPLPNFTKESWYPWFLIEFIVDCDINVGIDTGIRESELLYWIQPRNGCWCRNLRRHRDADASLVKSSPTMIGDGALGRCKRFLKKSLYIAHTRKWNENRT